MKTKDGKAIAAFVLSSSVFLLSSCATYQSKIEPARSALAAGRGDEAVRLVEDLARQESKDQLLYLLDLATALQGAGRFRESAEVFERAARQAEQVDYISLSRTAGSLVLAEEVQQYKTESYERVLIHVLNALNFLALGNWESTQVEVRRIQQLLKREQSNGRKTDLGAGFAAFLGGLIWESTGQWDDAAIAFANARRQLNDQPLVIDALLRASIRAGREDSVAALKRDQPRDFQRINSEDRRAGHVFILRLAGWAPRKEPNPVQPRFPELRSVVASGLSRINARLVSKSTAGSAKEAALQPILDVDQIARQALNEDVLKLLARRVAGAVTKEVLADQLRQRDQALGLLAGLLLHASDRADLRQWSTLPAEFQMTRIVAPPGDYTLEIEGRESQALSIKANERKFVVFRTY